MCHTLGLNPRDGARHLSPEGASVTAIAIENYLNDEGFFDHMAEDVRTGLSATPKSVPPKYFYDDLGSDLFEQITEQPEYYPMREEGKLLVDIAPELMGKLEPAQVVERRRDPPVPAEGLELA